MQKLLYSTIVIFLAYACSVPDLAKELKDKKYSINLEGDFWQELSNEIADKAYKSPSGAIVFFNSQCRKYSVPGLRKLQKNLFYGVDKLEHIHKEKVTIFNREGLYTKSKGRLDGVAVYLYSKIFNKDHCSYDIVLISPIQTHTKDIDTKFNKIEKALVF